MVEDKTWKEKLDVPYRFWNDFISPMIIHLKGDKCEHCGDEHSRLEVHHNDYDNITLYTLEVLCKKCHKKEHKKKVR